MAPGIEAADTASLTGTEPVAVSFDYCESPYQIFQPFLLLALHAMNHCCTHILEHEAADTPSLAGTGREAGRSLALQCCEGVRQDNSHIAFYVSRGRVNTQPALALPQLRVVVVVIIIIIIIIIIITIIIIIIIIIITIIIIIMMISLINLLTRLPYFLTPKHHSP